MEPHVALLRAVNLGPHKKIAMADLRAAGEALGFDGVGTVLQTGNLVFRAPPGVDLEARIEAELKRRLSLETEAMVRTAMELAGVIAENPFADAAREDPSHLVVMFLKAPLADGAAEALQSAIKGREQVRGRGREAYMVYPDGIGTSKVTPALVGRKLGVGTGRNWNTVLKIAAMMGV